MKTKALIVTVMIVISGVTLSFAQTRSAQKHPRRTEVNGRLANQDRRIHNEVKEGEISHKQAATLHRDDHHIRTEERRMASRHGGHITTHERARLNRQENRVSRKIGQ